ncbi:MAG: recombinase family protein [Tenericutes bacterium]|nr:recombinase family protein [Mycoplasmatota bacterium]
MDLNSYEKRNRKKNVCAYARVSTFKNLQETSFDLQVETYTKMIQNNLKWNFVGVYADKGKSGTHIIHREQFNFMIELAKAGNIDMIITKSVSRFARNTIDCLSIIQKLKTYSTEVWFEKENLSSFDPKIEFVISVMAGMAEEESRNISENVKWGVRKRFKNGIVPMVTSRVLGYVRDTNKNIIIDKTEAIIVKMIFAMYSEGASQRVIAAHLNSLGFKTKYQNKDWYERAVQGILNNEKYTGNAILQKSARQALGSRIGEKNQNFLPKYYVENSHPAIISQELWDTVHEIKNGKILKYNHTLDKKKLKHKAKYYSEYAEFIECAICGKNYHYKVNNKGTSWETRILICSSNREKKICTNDALFADTFDEILISQINRIIKNKEEFLNTLRNALIAHPAIIQLNTDLAQAQEKLDGIDAKLKELMVSSNELDRDVCGELIPMKQTIQADYIKYKNQLLTTHNISNKIKQFKTLLNGYKIPIKTLTEFPFKELFTKVRVHNRNEIEIILNVLNEPGDSSVFSFPAITTEFLIRKTTHSIESVIRVV